MSHYDLESAINRAVEILAKSRNAVALTGAGISAESGVPTFRGRNGLWSRYKPEDLATPEAFSRNPRLVWEWYKWRMEIVYRAQPNPAHLALRELEDIGVLKCIITQNVGGLDKKAGSKCVVELHGTLWLAKCTNCNYKVEMATPPSTIPPRCPICGSLMRPDVVWFGEPIPPEVLAIAINYSRECDIMLVVGTSGVVIPAGLLPSIAKSCGAKIVEVNIEESAITSMADVFVKSPAGRVLPIIVERVKRTLSR